MSSRFTIRTFCTFLLVMGPAADSLALQMDWKGTFRAETNTIWGYGGNQFYNATTDRGYQAPNTGDSPATFQNLFMSLNPSALVNDNVTLYSQIWVGTPDRGVFGSESTSGQYGNLRTGRSALAANAFWAEASTDFGTLNVGRVPLHWGQGLIWNSSQTPSVFSFQRAPTTADSIQMVTKLGAFRLIPTIAKYQNGTNYGGAFSSGTTQSGGSGVSDYSVGFLYDNPDEQIEIGILFLRRVAGVYAQLNNPLSIDSMSTGLGYAYNVWDFSAKKQTGDLAFSVEVPLMNGRLGGVNYSTVAGLGKLVYQPGGAHAEGWKWTTLLGFAPGQGNVNAGQSVDKFTAFQFHQDIRPGLIMFNYANQNFYNANLSPYQNPVSNAQFLNLQAEYATGKWTHAWQFVYALADKVADGVSGSRYFNSWDQMYRTQVAGASAQKKNMGFELDYGFRYQWDDAVSMGWATGLFFPGDFYKFRNGMADGGISTAFANQLNLTVSF